MRQPKAHILVVEDDDAIRGGLLDVLVFNGYAADGEADGERGLQAALGGRYDLVLLDVMLPSLDGLAVCRAVRRHKPALAVIMITARGAEEDIVSGFKAGADDYVPKPFSLRELMVRVEAVLRRSGRLPAETRIEARGIVFDGAGLQAVRGTRREELTRREMDIIAHLHRNAGRIVSRRELLTDIWHYADADIETRTVDIHMLKLRKKIQSLDEAAADLIQTVRGEGYRWEAGA